MIEKKMQTESLNRMFKFLRVKQCLYIDYQTVIRFGLKWTCRGLIQ